MGVHDRMSAALTIASATVLSAHLGVILLFIIPRRADLGFLRLHYTVALGVDWVAEWWKLFVFPAMGAGIFLLNAVFSGMLSATHRTLGLVMLSATATLELALMGGGLMAVLLNS